MNIELFLGKIRRMSLLPKWHQNCISSKAGEKQMLQEKSLLAARAKKWPCLPILIWLNLGKSKHRRRFFFPASLLHATSVTRLDWQQPRSRFAPLQNRRRRPIKKWSHIGHKLCTRTRMTTSLAPSILANERKLVDINQDETLGTFYTLHTET